MIKDLFITIDLFDFISIDTTSITLYMRIR